MSGPGTAPLFALKDVVKEFTAAGRKVRVLDGVSFTVKPGERIAVTGPSGSGKSTLLGLMAGLERPSSGGILVKGEPTSAWDEDRLAAWRLRSVGFIFQNFRLVSSLTALENVLVPLEIQGGDPAAIRERAELVLRSLGLAGREGHFPPQLSGGEQQRVAIARAHVHRPEVIFADEPTGSLDSRTADSIMERLLRINKEAGASLVLVTHNPELAGLMERSVALEGGRLRSS
ncbi:MAG: ABC transporter ATP-binding protein [Elusimicrobiota bacterium]